jgi:hypothetical protein
MNDKNEEGSGYSQFQSTSPVFTWIDWQMWYKLSYTISLTRSCQRPDLVRITWSTSCRQHPCLPLSYAASTRWFRRSYCHLWSSFLKTFWAKSVINLGPILKIYRVTFVIGIFLNFTFNFNYKITSSLCIYCHKNILISVDLFFCTILQRLQHIFKNTSLHFNTFVRTFVNRARCST